MDVYFVEDCSSWFHFLAVSATSMILYFWVHCRCSFWVIFIIRCQLGKKVQQDQFQQKHQVGNMNRRSESSFLSKTNRQFYVRRRKQPDDISDLKLGKVLKSLIRKNETYCESKPKKSMFGEKYDNQSKNKLNDRYFQIAESKRELEISLKKSDQIFMKLLRVFDKCICSESIQQMEFYQLNFYDLLNEATLISKSKSKNVQQSLKENENKQNTLLLQNMKLEKQNMMLRHKISYGLPQNEEIQKEKCCDEITKSRTVKFAETARTATNQDFITNFIMMERKLEVTTQELEIMKREIENLKEQIFLLRDEKKSLKQRILELKVKNENLCSEIIGLQLKNKKMGVSDDRRQAITMMQFEEIQSYRYEISQLKKIYLSLTKKYKALTLKFKKTTSDGNKLGSMYNRQMHMFPEQFEAFEEVRGKAHPSNRIHLVTNKEKRSERTPLYQQCFGLKQTLSNREGVKKIYAIGYQYYHPSFFALIAQDINSFGIDQSNFEHFNQTIKLNFMGTTRAIMDSKFNEFVMNRGSGLGCSFPSFVFAWLNTYQLGQTKKVEKVANNGSQSTREMVCTFYINLMSSKLNYSWEVIAFREFLLQTFNNDELYFYLNLRFLLIGGDISNDLSFCFEEIYYIDFNRCISIVFRVVKQGDECRQVYEDLLKRATVTIRKKGYLDLHYVLRVMLEYYQTLKRKEVESIIKTLDLFLQGSKNNIGLPEFQRIFDYHFEFLSLTEIVELFRKCFCAGNGMVTPETVITILNQENVFLRWVETLINNPSIRIDQMKGSQEENSFVITPNIDWMYENERAFRFIHNSQLAREAQSLGVQRFTSDLAKLYKLNSHTIFSRLELCFSVCLLTSRKFYYSGLVTNDKLEQVLRLVTDLLMRLSKVTLQKKEILCLMREMKEKAAGEKIVRFYHKKKAEMTRSILYAYSSNGLCQNNEQKNEVLRTEFMQIIEEAKVKKRESSKAIIQEI